MSPCARAAGGCAALAWFLVTISSCDRPAATPTKPDVAAPAAGWNVVLISVDTLRADHVGCYGNSQARTPNIDRLAAGGARFSQATTVAPITLPAHASLLTGNDPFLHGARDNGIFRFDEANDSLAERLSARGYRTSGHVAAAVIGSGTGIEQGFSQFTEPVRQQTQADAPPERGAEAVVSQATAWLEQQAAAPFFLFVHLFDPHLPHIAPQSFAAQFPNNPYLAEIMYADSQIGVLLDRLDALKLADRTIVVLTADHGEGLGQHDENTHAFLVYDSTLHIPLIVRAPGLVNPGTTIDAQVRLTDVAPTLLQWLGIDAAGMRSGAALQPLLAGRSAEARFAYSEALSGVFNFQFAPLRSWRGEGWKYIHGPRPELFHIAQDPGESRNLAESEPQRVEMMRGELLAYVEREYPHRAAAGGPQPLDAAAQRNLSALGYISAAAAPLDEIDEIQWLREPRGPHPADHAELTRVVGEAPALLYFGQHARVEELMRQLMSRPGFPADGVSVVSKSLGTALAAQRRFEEAIPHFESALRQNPRDAQAQLQLGVSLVKLDRAADALPLLHAAVENTSYRMQALEFVAYAEAATGNPDRALTAFAELLKTNPVAGAAATRLAERWQFAPPTEPDEPLRLAAASLERGVPRAALALLSTPANHTPGDPFRAFLAADALARIRDPRAAGTFLALLEMQPERADLPAIAARALVASRLYSESLKLLRSAPEPARDAAPTKAALAWILATSPDDSTRNGAEALQLAQAAIAAAGRTDAHILDALAAALAETGDFTQAVAVAREAAGAARTAGDRALAQTIRDRRRLYESGRPYRMP